MMLELFTTLPLILVTVFFAMGFGQRILSNFGHDRMAAPTSRGHESKNPDFAKALNRSKTEELFLLETLGVKKNLTHYQAQGWILVNEFKTENRKTALLRNGSRALFLTDTIGVITCLKKSGCE